MNNKHKSKQNPTKKTKCENFSDGFDSYRLVDIDGSDGGIEGHVPLQINVVADVTIANIITGHPGDQEHKCSCTKDQPWTSDVAAVHLIKNTLLNSFCDYPQRSFTPE